MSATFLFLAVFAACAVEAVEALTIVLAVGITRSWRSTMIGVVAALIVLAALVAALGPALKLIPIDALRIVVGGLLLIFGLQWLRKAMLRAAGIKALHDEDAIYARTRAAATDIALAEGRLDAYSTTIAFKGVLLEGLEVAFIVLTFGTNQKNLPVAAIAAGAAVIVVVILGAAVRGPLSRVPENTLKYVVGVLLTSFGIFWGGEGAGVEWPGSDFAILALVGFVGVVSVLLTQALRRRRQPLRAAEART